MLAFLRLLCCIPLKEGGKKTGMNKTNDIKLENIPNNTTTNIEKMNVAGKSFSIIKNFHE